jgi:DNA polymerase-3 subunit alpha
MYGAFKFDSAMKSEGMKPIIGCEIYVAPEDHTERTVQDGLKYYHLLLIAKNQKGYKNLIKLVSIGHMEGFYYKPRVDMKTIAKYSEGIIALSACLGGMVSKEFLRNDPEKAKKHAIQLKDTFTDGFYLELQRNGIEEQEGVNQQVLSLAKEIDVPVVATCDAHYLNKEDSTVQEVLWCIADGKTLDDPTRRKMETQEFYVKTPEEMEELFKDIPEAIENTQKIVESIEDFEISFGRIEPKYKHLPEGKTSKEYLKDLAYEGVEKKYGEFTDALKERTDYELSVIDEKGYNDYFLIVYQIVGFCRKNGIVVSMRGSGTGSIVAYGIDITSIDPIGWQLYFERFLNPERKSAPDFDIDLEDTRRHEVIDFVQKEFGEESVRQIITFSKLQTRQAIRDVSRVLSLDLAVADQLSKMVEIVFGKAKSLDYMIEENSEFAEIINSSDAYKNMADIVRKVSGLARGVSTHACGVLITPEPVTEYVAIQRDSHGEGIGIAQFEFGELEAVGLMKFDFLGLRNLGIIGTTLKKIEATRGEKIDLMNIDYNDPEAFGVINRTETVGVFQLESDGMKKTIKEIKPETVEEICYLVAAFRPGPMQFIPQYTAVKRGEEEPKYLFPELEPILSITNGVITYQEQVIKIAVDIGGYSMGRADILRKAMGKKKVDVMEAEKPVFLEGAMAKGYDKESLEELWELLLKFANYGFNKAHSAMYATVAYWTAYLKGRYPLEFMAALLEGDLGNFERTAIDLDECRRLGIDVKPPSINESIKYFKVEDQDKKIIRFGLGAIKNVGDDAVKAIVEEREKNGDYKNFDDFIYRNIEHKVQKRAIEYLIMAGVLDEFGDRNQMIEGLTNLHELYRKEKKSAAEGQFDLFSTPGDVKLTITHPSKLPDVQHVTVHQMLEWEKDLLGLYLSSHPLDDLQEFFQEKGAIPISQLHEMDASRKIVVVGGIAVNVKRIVTKKGDNMAFLSVEDKSGQIDMVVFPTTYEEMKDELQPNVPMLFAGKVNVRNEEKSFILAKAKVIDPDKFGSNFKGITFRIRESHSEDEIVELRKFIDQGNGTVPVRIIIIDDGGEKIVKISKKVDPDSAQPFEQKFR